MLEFMREAFGLKLLNRGRTSSEDAYHGPGANQPLLNWPSATPQYGSRSIHGQGTVTHKLLRVLAAAGNRS